ncbi:hypothetical protein MGQ_01603 [Candida albicans P76067]|nr:hypothetical protein MEQ_01590 [Candida albicans P87]KGU32311.1 hypothetical protein MGM_01654 [Candida albicans P75063]KHC39271.1 hypothetical protein MGQ_01603 [Candida albicans P76067]KHC72121.1 hypothetical protein MGI_01600 [Candida albicans P75016]
MGFPQLHLFPPFSFTLSYPFFLHIYHNHIFIQQLTQTQTQTPFPFIISSHSIVWFVNFHFFFFWVINHLHQPLIHIIPPNSFSFFSPIVNHYTFFAFT